MTTRYALLEAGMYLEEIFGFRFAEPDSPELQQLQDALFDHAGEAARRRSRLRRLLDSQQRDYSTMRKALQGGSLWYPLGQSVTEDPCVLARQINDDERLLKGWCAAVTAMQEAQGH